VRTAIAIDGPAGAGKSTVAKKVARILGYIYIDTGAMYRAAGLKALRLGISPKDGIRIPEMIESTGIAISFVEGAQHVLLDGEDVTDLIRTPEASVAASDISAIPAVRLRLVELQRRIAAENDVVMDGRDIGTFVLPHANCKIYLSATIEERTRRRCLELEARGTAPVDMESVRRDIEYRDYNDSHRALAPLAKAEDAFELDTTGLSVDEVVERIMKRTTT
jgi:cytidylate kinase